MYVGGCFKVTGRLFMPACPFLCACLPSMNDETDVNNGSLENNLEKNDRGYGWLRPNARQPVCRAAWSGC